MCWFGYLRRSIEKIGVSVCLWYRSNGFYFGCVGLFSNVCLLEDVAVYFQMCCSVARRGAEAERGMNEPRTHI